MNSILDQLRTDHSTFDVHGIFKRYCSLSGKRLSNEGLTCSIPIHYAQRKVMVDKLALSSSEQCNHWTQVYSPTQASQIIGNSSSCSTLLQWLQTWKVKYCDQNSVKRKLTESKTIDRSDPDFLPSDGCNYSADREGMFLPAALLCGPHGSGKTAAVYACAAESGYKVLGAITD